jgi:hypothetical protein
LTRDRQTRANGANARSSTGPKTSAGKARSARNALRHGLNIPVGSDPALAPQAAAIALVIAGPNADAETLDYARQISEAQVDLNRVRSLRTEVIARILSHPRSPPLRQVRLINRFLGRVEQNKKTSIDLETIKPVIRPDAKLAAVRGSPSA